jgi:hypothetical protein
MCASTIPSKNLPDILVDPWRVVQREPDFGVTGLNDDFAELLERAEQPA